jgi:anti-sigma B factor antagonist
MTDDRESPMSEPLVLQLGGDIDIAAVSRLRPACYAVAENPAHPLVLVDLAAVTFMDAAGLGLLVGMRRRRQQFAAELVLRNASQQVTRLLVITGLIHVFPDADLPLAEPSTIIDLRSPCAEGAERRLPSPPR